MNFFKDIDGETILVKAFCDHKKLDNLELLEPNTVDASKEKHVPAVTVDGAKITVTVGSVEHPMTEAHYIQFICLETSAGFCVRKLTPEDKPEAFFCLDKTQTPVAVYAYCNLHGLWKTEL